MTASAHPSARSRPQQAEGLPTWHWLSRRRRHEHAMRSVEHRHGRLRGPRRARQRRRRARHLGGHAAAGGGIRVQGLRRGTRRMACRLAGLLCSVRRAGGAQSCKALRFGLAQCLTSTLCAEVLAR